MNQIKVLTALILTQSFENYEFESHQVIRMILREQLESLERKLSNAQQQKMLDMLTDAKECSSTSLEYYSTTCV